MRRAALALALAVLFVSFAAAADVSSPDGRPRVQIYPRPNAPKPVGAWVAGILLGVGLAALGVSKCRPDGGAPLPEAAGKQGERTAAGEPDASKRVGGAWIEGS